MFLSTPFDSPSLTKLVLFVHLVRARINGGLDLSVIHDGAFGGAGAALVAAAAPTGLALYFSSSAQSVCQQHSLEALATQGLGSNLLGNFTSDLQ